MDLGLEERVSVEEFQQLMEVFARRGLTDTHKAAPSYAWKSSSKHWPSCWGGMQRTRELLCYQRR